MARNIFDDYRAFRHFSRDTRSHFDRAANQFGPDHAERSTARALSDAAFGRGPLAGKTGDRLIDEPFFNPWLKGGALNR